MGEFFASGRFVDLVLIMVVAEGLALTLYHRRTGRGVPPSDLAGSLLSGLCLLLALRAALVGAWWGWIGVFLTASLFTHAADLLQRWRKTAGRDQPKAG